MEAARLRTRGRRLRRGTVERPLNSRLVRVGFVIVVPALLALLFSLSPTGALKREPLEPLFNAESAAASAETLSVEFPSRVPGSEGASGGALWYRETIAALGLPTEEDVWTEELAGLGRVELRNVVTVIAGRSSSTIVVVAHRDNAGADVGIGENATGTAALIELARGYAPQEFGPDPLPQHTLVLVSTDAGAYGGAGAARFTSTALARNAIAVVVLDDLGSGQPRLAVAGDEPVSPARALVRTAAARIAEETGATPALPSVASQLVALGLPYALEEQGRFLAAGRSAVAVGTEGAERSARSRVSVERLGQLGRATEALVGSLDASVGEPFRTPDSIYFADRAASGWTLRLTLILAVVPFALGVVDLIVRGRHRGLPFRPALRCQRARLGFWLFAGLLLWLGSRVGVLPAGPALPLPPLTPLVSDPPLFGLMGIASLFGIGWLLTRERLVARGIPTAEERLAGLVVGLALAGCVAVAVAVVQPYALLFVLPSLYAWLWIPLEGRLVARALLFATGLLGPFVALALLAHELHLSVIEGVLYVVGLAAVGYFSPISVVLFLVWLAVAAQVGSLALGRYGAYAGGAEPPPPGRVRRLVRR